MIDEPEEPLTDAELPALVAELDAGDVYTRARSVGQLGLHARGGGSRALQALIGALASPHVDVRVGVVRALGDTRKPDVVPALIVCLRDDEVEVRARAVVALEVFRDARAVPALLAAVRDSEWRVRAGAARALGALGVREAVPLLIERIEAGQTPLELHSAAAALGQIGDPRAVPVLARVLGTDIPPHVRMRVEAALESLRAAARKKPGE